MGGKDHEAKVTTLSRELWGHAPQKSFEFWVSETAFPGEIPAYTNTLKLSTEVLFMDFLTVRKRCQRVLHLMKCC